jgi:hypothetical protein
MAAGAALGLKLIPLLGDQGDVDRAAEHWGELARRAPLGRYPGSNWQAGPGGASILGRGWHAGRLARVPPVGLLALC